MSQFKSKVNDKFSVIRRLYHNSSADVYTELDPRGFANKNKFGFSDVFRWSLSEPDLIRYLRNIVISDLKMRHGAFPSKPVAEVRANASIPFELFHPFRADTSFEMNLIHNWD